MEHVFVCPVVRLKFCNGQNRDARVPALTSESDDEAVPGGPEAWEYYYKRKVLHSTGTATKVLKNFHQHFSAFMNDSFAC